MVVMKPYRPSSGSEGRAFMADFCDRCERDRLFQESPEKHDGCSIAADTMALRVTDPEYPKEWVEDRDGARCTAFTPRHT